jgi:hypothetical protein
MKITEEKHLAGGKVEITMCTCPGKISICDPKDRKHQTFKSMSTFNTWKKYFIKK